MQLYLDCNEDIEKSILNEFASRIKFTIMSPYGLEHHRDRILGKVLRKALNGMRG